MLPGRHTKVEAAFPATGHVRVFAHPRFAEFAPVKRNAGAALRASVMQKYFVIWAKSVKADSP